MARLYLPPPWSYDDRRALWRDVCAVLPHGGKSMDIMTIGLTVLALVIGAALGYVLQSRATTKRIGDADELAKRIVEEARWS